jgi:iron complex outermembrane receptor protein
MPLGTRVRAAVSDTEARRGYADLGFKGTGSEFHLNYTGATGQVGVTAAVPEELLAFGGRTRTFTSPQITDNDMQMVSASGVVDVTPTMSVSGVTYYRHFRQSHLGHPFFTVFRDPQCGHVGVFMPHFGRNKVK